MRRVMSVLILFGLLPSLLFAQNVTAGSPTKLPGLIQAGQIIRDVNGIPHIMASNDHDLMFLQGYAQAQDRLFQMDLFRRLASGTSAELFGASVLAQDVKTRTLGFRRGAAASWPLLSPRMQAMLRAFSDGINAYASSHPPAPEYAILGITTFEPWTPTDSLAIARLLAFQLAFDLDDVNNTIALVGLQTVYGVEKGTAVYFEDLYRSAPFEMDATVPDALSAALTKPDSTVRSKPRVQAVTIPQSTVEGLKRFMQGIENMPLFKGARENRGHGGSNAWAVSGKLTTGGAPLLASDPHLSLTYPAIFYPMQLTAGTIDEVGQSVPGAPLLLLGHNRFISWGMTTEYADVTDYYQEQIVLDELSPSGMSTVYKGRKEPIIPIPETFRVNNGGQLVTVPPGNGIPPYTLIVPRRNNGPIVDLNLEDMSAVSVQWTGFSGSREFDAMLAWAEARNIAEFQVGVNLFDCPPQNLMYSDVAGNIAYFAAGEIPVREDLQAETIHFLPPQFLRDGTGGNEWLPVTHPQPLQTLPYEILSASEMPHVINPPSGFVVNANNDPAGLTLDNNPYGHARPHGGIFYMTFEFNPGFRAHRINALLQQKIVNGKVSVADMKQIQADTVLDDAQFFVPYILEAWNNAHRPDASPALKLFVTPNMVNPYISGAAEYLAHWDFSTPTGIPEGYDGFDILGQTKVRSAAEVQNSIAASIFTMWRAMFVRDVIDSQTAPYGLPVPNEFQAMTALRNVLENFGTRQGAGVSGINFFPVNLVTNAADRRDIFILRALAEAAGTLMSPPFQGVFQASSLDDLQWGKCHRIEFAHPLDSVFSVPPALGAFPAPLAGRPGIPTDGGYQTVDEADHPLRITSPADLMWSHGPSHRFVSEASKNGVHAIDSLPGGISGVPTDPLYFNLLPQWLVNDTYDVLYGKDELKGQISSVTKFVPAN